MSVERVNPADLSPPTGFSHAVVATGSRVVFLAGQTALDADGKVVGESLDEQFERALANLLAALEAAGGAPADLARVTVYATDVADYRRRDDHITFTHTEIDDGHEGEGLGSFLSRSVLDTAGEAGLAVHPACPFVARYIKRHPRPYLDLVPEQLREKYGVVDAG